MKPINQFHPVGFDAAKAAAALKQQGLSAMLLTSPENVFYTTGYTALPSAGNPILYMLRNRLPFFSFVNDKGRVTLMCWGFSATGMDFGVDEVIGFNNDVEAMEALKTVVGERCRDGAKLGVESSCSYSVLRTIEGASAGLDLVEVDQVLDDLRLIKSPAEVTLLKQSLLIVEQTCSELFDLLRVGMGRSELAREARYRLLRNGAEGVSHITCSFTQANPEFDIDEPLEKGKLVTIDLGAIHGGYCSDNRRYAFAGDVPAEIADVHAKMVGMVDSVGAALTPGASFQGLMDLTRDLYRQNGLKPLGRFNHVGHNIGLETEERWLDDDEDATVKAGMVINIELYSAASTGEQIGNEESYVIGESGPTQISALSREIRSIG